MSNPQLDIIWPEHSTCAHCGKPITFDEWVYVHDDTWFADCDVLVEGGQVSPGGKFRIDPSLVAPAKARYAEPKHEESGG